MDCGTSGCFRDGDVVALVDGRTAVVRGLDRGDATAVAEVFDGLSDRSRRERFGGAKTRLTPAELDALSAVECSDHEALVAYDAATARAVAVVRFVRDGDDPTVAEVAYEVADEWQGRRLGSRLLELLTCRARELGIKVLRGDILADNAASQAVLRRVGRLERTSYHGSSLELVVAL